MIIAQPAWIVVLNGPSSSGKTTIAECARAELGENWVVLSIDDLFRAVHPKRPNDWSLYLTLTKVLFESAACFARLGFDVIVDTVFERPECHVAYLESCHSFQRLLVRVECPLEMLLKRELERGNRRRGLAASQLGRVHTGLKYDVSLDTSVLSPKRCANEILRHVATKPG